MSYSGINNRRFGLTGTKAIKESEYNPNKNIAQNVLDRNLMPIPQQDDRQLVGLIKKYGIGIGDARLTQYEKYEKFARIPRIDPNSKIGYSREFIFFTKPDLQLGDKFDTEMSGNEGSLTVLNNSTIFKEANSRYSRVLDSLSYSRDRRMPFVPLLSNYKRSNVDIPDISTSNDYETAKNILGSSMFYRGTSYESDENHDFSIEFEDTKYLEVYMWFRLYDEYERMKHYGLVPRIRDDYRTNKIIHDQMSMFKFIVGEDGESIIHYSKFTGVFPRSVPRNVFSDMPEDGILKFTVNFKATFVEDMEPLIIEDFNELSNKIRGTIGGSEGSRLGGFLPEYDGWSGEYMSRPYIQYPNVELNKGLPNKGFYKLKWEA